MTGKNDKGINNTNLLILFMKIEELNASYCINKTNVTWLQKTDITKKKKIQISLINIKIFLKSLEN